MRITKVQRIIAFVLALGLLLGCTFAIHAKGNDESALSNIRELLNAISYEEYRNSDSFKQAVDATEELVISGFDGVYTNAAGDVVEPGEAVDEKPVDVAEGGEEDEGPDPDVPRKYIVDGKEGLYIPDAGSITWMLKDVTEAKKYTLEIEYYPVENKSAAIERILLINDKVPFAEARYLKISKIWSTPYQLAKIEVGKKESADAIKKEAEAAGFKAVSIEKAKDGKKEKTYVRCEIPPMWNEARTDFVNKYSVRFFTADIDKNEIREGLEQTPEWQTYTLKDSNGFTQDPFVFVMEPDENGNVSISLESVNEPIVI